MTEYERKAMLLTADTLQGEINRMCVTHDLSEFDTMYAHAKVNLEKLSKIIYLSRFNLAAPLPEHIAPPAEPDFNTISYQNCAFALRKMWIDNILTSREYIEISDRLSAIQKGM